MSAAGSDSPYTGHSRLIFNTRGEYNVVQRRFLFTGLLIRKRLLFWKVLMLILAVSAAATFAISMYMRYVLRDSYADFLHEQVGTYVSLLIARIGVPPDTAATIKLTRQYPIDIRIESRDGLVWRSDTSVVSGREVANDVAPSFHKDDSLLLRRHNDHYYAVLARDSLRYVIRLRSIPEQRILFSPTLLMAVALLILVTVAYLFVQRSMRPINELMKGVEAIGSGDFAYRVPLVSRDEMGTLTRAFNTMSSHVAAMIASKRRLMFDVSHELRSPLTRINVALAMLPEGKAAKTIERNVQELNTMITELLENERLAVLGGRLVVEAVDVVDLTRRVVESFSSDAARISFDSLTPKVVITADEQRLLVALRNVISNALKYSAGSDNDHVHITVFPDEHGTQIVVTDHGVGISPEEQEHVFEPFYRTDIARSRTAGQYSGGYGLGLSLTKSIVEAHSGTVRLESQLGTGTTITISLPESPASNAVVRNVTAAEEGRLTI